VQAYEKLAQKWSDAQEKQKAKLVKLQLKLQEEEVRAKLQEENEK